MSRNCRFYCSYVYDEKKDPRHLKALVENMKTILALGAKFKMKKLGELKLLLLNNSS